MNTPRDTILIDTRYGHQIRAFTGELITRKIIKSGVYDGITLDLMLDLMQQIENPVVVDIGANIGNHTLAFATGAGQVFSFEPIPEVFAVLQDNVSRNKLDNVQCFNLALSDHDGEQTFYINTGGNLGASSFEQRELNQDAESITVTMRVGDTLLPEYLPSRLDIIKIDVEGHEPSVLRGLTAMIKQYQPLVMLEWNEQSTAEQLIKEGVFEQLFGGYSVKVLGSNYDRALWQGRFMGSFRRRLTRWFQRRKGCTYAFDASQLYRNILLVPPGKETLLTSR